MASNDTYEGALEVLLTQLAKMKGLQDSNLPFIIQIETQIVEEFRSPERKMQQAGLLPSGLPGQPGPTAPMQPGMGGGPGGMSAPPSSMMGAGNAGGMASPPSANPDELRRILQA